MQNVAITVFQQAAIILLIVSAVLAAVAILTMRYAEQFDKFHIAVASVAAVISSALVIIAIILLC